MTMCIIPVVIQVFEPLYYIRVVPICYALFLVGNVSYYHHQQFLNLEKTIIL